MTDEEFSAFCAEHPDLNFEMTAEAELIIMPPTSLLSGASNSDVDAQLATWARKDRRGVVCDSSTGFVLPNGARRSPNASWTLKSRVQQMGDAAKKGFLHLCPNFVIEIKSDTDRLSPLQKKMREYIEPGAALDGSSIPQGGPLKSTARTAASRHLPTSKRSKAKVL